MPQPIRRVFGGQTSLMAFGVYFQVFVGFGVYGGRLLSVLVQGTLTKRLSA